MTAPPSFLIIQTAFIGDVVLATALAEKLHAHFPQAAIDFLVRKGNETLMKGHPFLRKTIVWDKKKEKTQNLIRIIRQVRSTRYDYVINVHRFMSSGLITFFSGAKITIGFDKNPMSSFFSQSVKHIIAPGIHEVMRNQTLIRDITDEHPAQPRLYPSQADRDSIARYLGNNSPAAYLCIAPTSVWFTKQYPLEKWIEFMDHLPESMQVYLLGGAGDRGTCESIAQGSTHTKTFNLAGDLSYLESAAMMQSATMNFVNDSAPVHFASSVNAPVTALFCSTVPDFGFGPLSDKKFIVETSESLPCRPCGLHGFNACPQGHFKCARTISKEQLLSAIN